MRHRIAVGTSLAVLLLAGGVIAGEGLKSGPQPGTSLAPFSPLNLNGDSAGEKVCQI